jgi:hypothetical protein
MEPPIDWSPFDKYPEDTVTCGCGAVFRSHGKYVIGTGLVSRKPCPGCNGAQLIRSLRGDPELMTIGGSKD